MCIQIETKKVVIDGKPFRKIIKLKALPANSLPNGYLNMKSGPSIFRTQRLVADDLSVNCFIDHAGAVILEEIRSVPENEFRKRLVYIKAAGQRLMQVKKAIRATKRAAELEKRWHGEEAFRI
jgi:hypothetical protein